MVAREDVVIQLASRRALGDDDIYLVARQWSISVLAYGPGEDAENAAEEESEERPIGRGTASIIDPDRAASIGVDIWDALDATSADLSHLSMVFDGGGFADDLPIADPWGSVLLLEQVQLEEGSRGHGLGPVVLAGMIDQLEPGCSFAALVPAPIGDPIDGKTYAEAVASLERTWSRVGFESFRNGIWLLDLASGAFDEPRRRLLGF